MAPRAGSRCQPERRWGGEKINERRSRGIIKAVATTDLPFRRAAKTAARGVFEEGGLVIVEVYVVWLLCALCVVVVCAVWLCDVVLCLFVRCSFVRLFCEVAVYFLRLYNMELVGTNMHALRCVGSDRYYLNSKQDIWIQNGNLCGLVRWIWICGGANGNHV